MQNDFVRSRIFCHVDGTELAAIHRDGDLTPIVFLHGFGSPKEDYAGIVRYEAFAGHPFVAYDAPGCGETQCADLSKVLIPFLAKIALAVLDAVTFEHFHLVGHSMGGLTALMLAHQYPERVLSFVDIEGNIAPEDCFLSRQIIDYPDSDSEKFFDAFIERTLHAPAFPASSMPQACFTR